MAVKKRRILQRDWDSVAEMINTELKNRKASKFRKSAERRWKEVDRQVAMESLSRTKKDPHSKGGDWRSALELGELSRASEILSADIRRMAFPDNWFEAHAELPERYDENGDLVALRKEQIRIDRTYRALMNQQHKDFGFKKRVDLSIKEALHHGSYVVECARESMLGVMYDDNGAVQKIEAPVWKPHSMWNCYPECSQAENAGSLFYTGSMIIISYMKYEQLQRMTGPGWMKENIKKVDKPGKGDDVEVKTWHGDVTLSRKGSDDVYLPNFKVMVADDQVIFQEANPLPFSRIIYNGYERLDVRDPYFVSPLTKMSPTQKIASALANKFLDAVDLAAEPPVVYDGNDPDLVAMGGPDFSPGSKTPTKSLANFKVMEAGDPAAALQGLQLHMTELQKGTGVDNVRSGMSAGTEATATEIERTRQGGQIRTTDFLSKHEEQGLRPFLYLQHEMNKKYLKNYLVYNPEMGMPDFERLNAKDIPKNVHFEVTGAKSTIEAEQRAGKIMMATKFAVELGYGEEINISEVVRDLYMDAGAKTPERYLKTDQTQDPAEIIRMAQEQMAQLQQQAQEEIAMREQEMAKMQEQIQTLSLQEQSRMADAQVKAEVENLKAQNDQMELQLKAEVEQQRADNDMLLAEKQSELRHEEEMFKIFVASQQKEESSEDMEEGDENEPQEESANFEAMLQAFREVSAAPINIIRDKEGKITGAEKEI